jgi:ligand-binding sensor domain-containing protein
MKITSCPYFLIFILSFFIVRLTAQEIPFKNYTVKAGYNLPSNEFYAIAQDNQGYIWLGTSAGLVKFDGYNFTTYTTRDGLVDNTIWSLLIDKSGSLWIGTENGGISVLKNGKFKSITTNDGLVSNAVGKLFSDNKGNIWALGYDGGVSIISPDTIRSFNKENSVLNSEITCIASDKKGTIFLGNFDGLYYYDSEIKAVEKTGLEKCRFVWDISFDEYERLWIATQEDGVFCYSADTVLRYTTKNGLTSNTILSILVASNGKIFVGTYDGGINVIENSMVTDIYNSNSNLEVWQIYEDKKGRIWGNTKGNGLLLIENSVLKNLSKSNLLVDNFVTRIFEDDNNNIWFTTLIGLSKLGKTVFENFSSGFIGNDNKVLSVYASTGGKVYAGTYAGLNYYNFGDTSIKNVSLNYLPSDPSVYAITGDKKSNLWLGTYGGFTFLNHGKSYFSVRQQIDNMPEEFFTYSIAEKDGIIYSATDYGLLVLENGNYHLYNTDDGLIDNRVSSVAIDNINQVWCGTDNGLSILSDKKFHNFTTYDGLSDNTCNDIAFDKSGVAWIATEYGITSAILEKDFRLSTRKYSTSKGLGSNLVFSIIVDNQQQVWMGHNRGVDCFNPRTKEVRNYTSFDGFLPVENNVGAIDIDTDNNIWFGTIDGLVKYIPENEVRNTLPPKIYITGVNLYNDSSLLSNYFTAIDSITGLPKDLKLNHTKRNLYFTYVGLHYTVVEKNKYKYRLLGYDDEWSQPTNEIVSVPFQRISPGHYVFQVMAANCDGVWNDKPAEFSFQILPPFWQTWWARIIEFLLLIGTFYLIIYLRERKLRYDKKVLQQKVTERTIEIEKQKDQIEVQRDEIAHQKQEITDSIEYAKHIQSAILPKDETIAPLLKNYFILYKPRDIVSGDFYWINSYGEKIIAIAADCTGHGVPGAFMSMLGVSALNEITTNNYCYTFAHWNRRRSKGWYGYFYVHS